MWYEDLAKFDFFGEKISKLLVGEENAEILIAVGWLENGKHYTTGDTPKSVCEKLYEFSKTRELYFAFLGRHECDLCDVYGNPNNLNFIDDFGSKTIFIAFKNKVYIFPDLIIHYINAHSYLPPEEFIEAVLASTPQETIEYFRKIRENNLSKIK
jgi:hypothetical protein